MLGKRAAHHWRLAGNQGELDIPLDLLMERARPVFAVSANARCGGACMGDWTGKQARPAERRHPLPCSFDANQSGIVQSNRTRALSDARWRHAKCCLRHGAIGGWPEAVGGTETVSGLPSRGMREAPYVRHAQGVCASTGRAAQCCSSISIISMTCAPFPWATRCIALSRYPEGASCLESSPAHRREAGT